MGNGYHLHSNGPRVPLPGRDYGLGEPRGLSNTMHTSFCVEALDEALARFGKPEIFNTDQSSQFTSTAFADVLKRHEIRSRWMVAAAGWIRLRGALVMLAEA